MQSSCWTINISDRSPSHFGSWVESLLGTTLSRKPFQQVGVLEQFLASSFLGPQEDLLHHIQSLVSVHANASSN